MSLVTSQNVTAPKLARWHEDHDTRLVTSQNVTAPKHRMNRQTRTQV